MRRVEQTTHFHSSETKGPWIFLKNKAVFNGWKWQGSCGQGGEGKETSSLPPLPSSLQKGASGSLQLAWDLGSCSARVEACQPLSCHSAPKIAGVGGGERRLFIWEGGGEGASELCLGSGGLLGVLPFLWIYHSLGG